MEDGRDGTDVTDPSLDAKPEGADDARAASDEPRPKRGRNNSAKGAEGSEPTKSRASRAKKKESSRSAKTAEAAPETPIQAEPFDARESSAAPRDEDRGANADAGEVTAAETSTDDGTPVAPSPPTATFDPLRVSPPDATSVPLATSDEASPAMSPPDAAAALSESTLPPSGAIAPSALPAPPAWIPASTAPLAPPRARRRQASRAPMIEERLATRVTAADAAPISARSSVQRRAFGDELPAPPRRDSLSPSSSPFSTRPPAPAIPGLGERRSNPTETPASAAPERVSPPLDAPFAASEELLDGHGPTTPRSATHDPPSEPSTSASERSPFERATLRRAEPDDSTPASTLEESHESASPPPSDRSAESDDRNDPFAIRSPSDDENLGNPFAIRSSSDDEDVDNPFASRSSNDDERGNPFDLRSPSDDETPRSFLDAGDSVPSGLQAMFGSAVPTDEPISKAPGATSRRDSNEPGEREATSERSLLDDDRDSLLGDEQDPLLRDGPRAADSRPEESEPLLGDFSAERDWPMRPREESRFDALDDAPPSSVYIEPAAPSVGALDAALGSLLGTNFEGAMEAGKANMASQVNDLLRVTSRAPKPGAEVDFGGLVDELGEDPFGGDSRVPPAAETLRGAVFDDDPLGDPATRAALRGAGRGGWDGIPGQVDLSRIRGGSPSDDVVDVDGADVHSVPPPSPQRWPDNESDDFIEPPRRRGSSPAAQSSAPPAPVDELADEPEYEPEDEPTADSTSPSSSASEWGSVPPPALSERQAIPNYVETLERLVRPASMAPGARAQSEPRGSLPSTSSPPATSLPPLAGRPKPLVPNLGVWLAVLVVLGAVGVTLLPWYLLQRAEKHAANCFRDILRTAEGDPQTCVPTTSELALAKSLPWLEEDARRVRESSDFRAARLAYDKATAIVPNAAKRDEAARKLLELTYRGTSSERTAALGVVAGAHAAVTQFALANREAEAVSFALRSARATGQLEDMRALATGSSEEDPFGMSLRRGALLCLLGDANEGARAFVAADLSHQRLNTSLDGNGLARLGLVACGRPKGVNGEIDAHEIGDRIRPAMAALEASLDTQEGFAAARSFLEEPKFKVGGIQRLRIAPWVIRETKPSALEALRLLAPQHAPAARLDLNATRTSWTMLDIEAPVQAVYVDPSVAETAAPYLEELAEKVDSQRLDCSGEECPDPAALKLPEAILKEAARMLWFEAAAEHARLGHREAALEAAKKATELAVPSRRHLNAPIHLAVGDAEGALALLAEPLAALESYTPLAQTRIHMNQTLALAHLGRFDKAVAAAQKAFEAAGRAEEAARESSGGLDADVAVQDDRIATAWLWGAMSLVVGKPDEFSEALRTTTSKELAEVASWVGLATRPEEERRVERWDLALPTPSQPALPAVMYVVSRAVPSMTDVEVWLDRMFQQEHRTQPTRAMLARSEAARWRNDPESERAWQSRAAKVLGLIKDYRTSLLAHLLELH